MKPTQITSAILCSSLLLGTTAALADFSYISQVQLNSALTQMTITGKGFAAGEKVILGSMNITSQCSLGSATLPGGRATGSPSPVLGGRWQLARAL